MFWKERARGCGPTARPHLPAAPRSPPPRPGAGGQGAQRSLLSGHPAPTPTCPNGREARLRGGEAEVRLEGVAGPLCANSVPPCRQPQSHTWVPRRGRKRIWMQEAASPAGGLQWLLSDSAQPVVPSSPPTQHPSRLILPLFRSSEPPPRLLLSQGGKR